MGALFQNDNINSLDSGSEFRLVVMAGVAQDEVRKLSVRLKLGFHQIIKNGFVLCNGRLWDYDKKGWLLTINEAETKVVRCIFHLYANEQMRIQNTKAGTVPTKASQRTTAANGRSFWMRASG